jgi:glycosyltransferase involved in cell wall biosynthesis
MRVLQLSKKVPFPIKDGESMAICSLASSLSLHGVSVHLLALNTNKHKVLGTLENEIFSLYHAFSAVEINTNPNLFSFLTNLLTPYPYQLARFVNRHFKMKLMECLSTCQFDFIFLETIYLTPYIPIIKKLTKAKIVLRTHNLENEIWRRLYKGAAWGTYKLIYKFLSLQIYNYEAYRLKHIDLFISISDREHETFKKLYPGIKGYVMPITAIDRYDGNTRLHEESEITLFFIGSLDWKPNQEGLLWFLDNVWPLLLAANANLKFYVAGRNMPNKIRQLKIVGVTFVGEVEDAVEFVMNHNICIVPLLSGSGMRAKIIESMSLGKVVVTTSLGLEGIKATHNVDVCVADTPESFVSLILQLLADKSKMKQIGLNALNTIKNNYDSGKMGQKLVEFLKHYH